MLTERCNVAAPAESAVRRCRDEHLAAVSRRHDPRCLVYVETDVLRRCRQWFAGVDADSNSNRVTLGPVSVRQRQLALRGGRDCGSRICERDEECVTLVIDLVAALTLEGFPQQPPVKLERVTVSRRPQPLQEPRRALDVGEEERHGSGGLRLHEPNIAPDVRTAKPTAWPTRRAWYPVRRSCAALAAERE